MRKLLSEWCTKQEIMRGARLTEAEFNESVPKLISEGKAEQKGNKYRIKKEYVNTFLNELQVELKKQEVEKLAKIGFLNKEQTAFNEKGDKWVSDLIKKDYQKTRKNTKRGYLYLKEALTEKTKLPEEVYQFSEEIGMSLRDVEFGTLFNDAELFEIDDKVDWILMMTDNHIGERLKPYDKFVIDRDIHIDDYWFKGIIVTSTLAWTTWGKDDLFCSNKIAIEPFINGVSKIDEVFITGTNFVSKKVLMKLKTYICNFIDFINQPEVRIIRVTRSKKNIERRKKAGKIILPSSNKIKITGSLHQYYEKIGSYTGRQFNYRFWVRGHFMRFWNKEKFKHLYRLLAEKKLPDEYYVDEKIMPGETIIARFKKPFIKGEGMLISKKYKLEK